MNEITPTRDLKDPVQLLTGLSDYPVPDGVHAGMVTTPDGVELRYARFAATAKPAKGTVIILQGRAEFIEKYYETVEDLRARGFGVLTFDWRGQGGSTRLLSDRRKGHVDHFNQYLMDLETILTEIALPDCRPPHYILAHSAGALVALLAAPALENRIRRMVLCGPLLDLENLPLSQQTLRRVFGVMSFLGLGQMKVGAKRLPLSDRPFIGNALTSDLERFQRNKRLGLANPDLIIDNPTVSWLFAACRAMDVVRNPDYANASSVPALLLPAGADSVVSTPVAEAFGRTMRAGTFITIAGARHEIMQEQDVFREQFLAAFDSFIPGTTDDLHIPS